MAQRKLASVQYVHHVTPIEGADQIECIHVLGWQCVAKKGEFQVGNLCVYFEVDSFLPIEEKFEFLRKGSYKKNDFMGEGFRLKSRRIRGQISQGLALPLDILPEDREYQIGEDVSILLGVRKWEEEEKVSTDASIKGGFPHGIPKTDELRVQSEPKLIKALYGKPYYITTKMDGTSVTMYWKDGNFGVCSRNYELQDDGKNAFWKFAKEIGLEERLRAADFDDVAIQGEFCGAGIQKNPLALRKPEWYVFTMIDLHTGGRYNLQRMQEACEKLNLSMVPLEETGESFSYVDVDSLLERAKGKYPSGRNKEGIVIRPITPEYSPITGGPLSMKVINNDYLLK